MIRQVATDKAYLCALFFEFICQGQAAYEMAGADFLGCVGAKGRIINQVVLPVDWVRRTALIY